MLSRLVSGVFGIAIVGVVAHYSIINHGGYSWTSSPLFVGLALAIVGGAVVAGRCDHRGMALCFVALMCAAEGYQLIQTAERTTGLAEARQTPLREAATARQKAAADVAQAEDALSRLGDTPRLFVAIEAKKAADEAVRTDAAKPGCKTHCRALLEQQVTTAQKEIDDARAEIQRAREAATRDLTRAREAFATLPAAASATPLADRTGIEQWKIDLVSALLLSLGLNGSGALLIAHAFEARRSQTAAEPIETPIVELVPVEKPAAKRVALKEANRFAGETFRPSDAGRVPLLEVRRAYHDWCAHNGIEPLSDAEIGPALSKLFDKVGLTPEGTGREAVIVGIDWSQRAITKAA